MASQALLVVLSPTIVAIGDDLNASVGAVGQARAISAAVAITASIALARRIDALGIPLLLRLGAALAIIACAAVALSPTLAVFLLAHVLIGVAFACLLSAGFAGVAAFSADRRAWAIGYVAGANALAWIVVNPIVGAVTDLLSWRAAQAVPAAIAVASLIAPRAATSASAPPGQIRTLLAERSARRWIGAELIAYGAWTALLTFLGAFFIQQLGVGEGAVGWLLAGGAATYFAASSHSGALVDLFPRRHLVAGSALLMAALVIAQLSVESAAIGVGIFCLLGLAAGVRTPASSGLGLEQLPDHPGAMMAGRTAATQLGYLLGAVIGGAVITGAGYGALGVVLALGMVASALLILRVDDPLEAPSAHAPGSPGSTNHAREEQGGAASWRRANSS
jgi:predicted MFS family arabinose efflux permease